MVNNPPAAQETRVLSLGWEDHLEKAMAAHSSILAWRIPRAEYVGSQKVGHDRATNTFTFSQGEEVELRGERSSA